MQAKPERMRFSDSKFERLLDPLHLDLDARRTLMVNIQRILCDSGAIIQPTDAVYRISRPNVPRLDLHQSFRATPR